jgi:MOSC domain-containing protein YiiM
MTEATGTVHSLHVSPGGVPKHAVPQAHVHALGLEGDAQRQWKFHGGPERAVCLWSLHVIESLARDGHPIEPGAAGENVTVRGIDWHAMVPGIRVEIGEVLLELAQYATPCKTIAHVFHDGDMMRISHKRHDGVARLYARVVREGTMRVGDVVRVLDAVSAE